MKLERLEQVEGYKIPEVSELVKSSAKKKLEKLEKPWMDTNRELQVLKLDTKKEIFRSKVITSIKSRSEYINLDEAQIFAAISKKVNNNINNNQALNKKLTVAEKKFFQLSLYDKTNSQANIFKFCDGKIWAKTIDTYFNSLLDADDKKYNSSNEIERRNLLWNYLVNKKNVPKIVAAWILWNAKIESFDRKKSKLHFHTSTYGDWGKSLGLFQWHKWRKSKLISYALAENKSPYSYKAQLDFMLHELESMEARNWLKKTYTKDGLYGSTTSEHAAENFCGLFERPWSNKSLNERKQAAKDIENDLYT